MVDVWPGLEAELEDDLRSDLNPSELDFLARISGARVDNRPFRHEEDTALIGPLLTDPAFRCPAVVGLVVMGPAEMASAIFGQATKDLDGKGPVS
jgi:hypothetical protein